MQTIKKFMNIICINKYVNKIYLCLPKIMLMNFNFLFQLRQYSFIRTKHQIDLLARGLPKQSKLNGVQQIIIIASGKGGVGKSTTSGNITI